MSEADKKTVSSSMIELKAELYRKQEEFRNQKASSAGFVKGRKVEKGAKPSIWSRKNKGISDRAKRDEQASGDEDEDALVKSRKALEEKSKLYEKITSNSDIPEEDGSQYFLVDFQKKAIDTIVTEREAQRKREEEEKEREEEKRALAEPVPEAATPDEEWVDFTDSLGRSRRCLRKDLDHLMKQDRDLALAQIKQKKGIVYGSQAVPSNSSIEEYREKMRQKWDKETEVLDSQGHGQVHYSNVQYDEIRTHGVGFFQFSKDHETREEQLEYLKKLREETLDEKSRKERIKEKRKNMMEARLAKVRQRRKLKDNTEQEAPMKEEEAANEDASSEPNNSVTEEELELKKKKEEEEKEAEEKRKNHLRDWDKGKTSVEMMYHNYVDKRRQERDEDFAPPSLYFQDKKTKQGKNQTVKSSLSDKARISRLQELTKPTKLSPQVDKETDSRINELVNRVVPSSEEKEASSLVGPSSSNPTFPDFDLSSVPLPTDNSSNKTVIENKSSTNSQSDFKKQIRKNSPTQQFNSSANTPAWPTVDYQQNLYYSGEQAMPQHNYQQAWPVGEQMPQYPQQSSHLSHPTVVSAENYSVGQQNVVWNSQPQYPGYNSSIYGPDYNYNAMSQPSSSTTTRVDATHQQQQSYVSPNSNSYTNTTQNLVDSSLQQPPKRQADSSSLSSTSPPVKKKLVPKQAVVDTRFMQNDADPSLPEMATIEAPTSVEGVEYTFGSFTAAKTANQEHFEDVVVQSQQKSHISGGAHLYTAEELKEKQEQDERAKVEEKVQDFLDSLK